MRSIPVTIYINRPDNGKSYPHTAIGQSFVNLNFVLGRGIR